MGNYDKDYETLIVTEDDGVIWVSLNRPQVRNAINQQMQDEISTLWRSMPRRRRRPLHRPHRRRRRVLHRDRPQRVARRTRDRVDRGGQVSGLPHALGVRRPGTRPRPEELRPLEAGDRGGAGHGVRRRVLHARRDRVHHRRRQRDLLRPPRHLRHDRGVRTDPDAQQDAVPRGHAHVAARRPRTHDGRAGSGDRPRDRSCTARGAAGARRMGGPGHRRLAGARGPGHLARAVGRARAVADPGDRDGHHVHQGRHRRRPRSRKARPRFASGVRPQWRSR